MQVRNATSNQIEAVKAANPDKSDGSATPKNRAGRYSQALIDGQDKSIELCEGDRVVAARVMEAPRPAATVREQIEHQSKTIEELTRIAKVNPVYEPILALRQHAQGLAPGQEKDKFVQLAKDQLVETQGQFIESETQSEDQESCGSHSYEPQQKAITIGKNSYSPENLISYDNKQSGIVSDATNAKVAKDIPYDDLDKRPIRDYGYQVTAQDKDKVKALETGVAYEVSRQQVAERTVFERVAALPLHYQALVLHAGIKAYRQEIDHQQFRIAVGEITGLGESVVGMARGADSLGKSICDVAQFSQDIAENNPRAQETAEQAGQSFGKLLVGGFSVVKVADNYLGSVGAASVDGDNTKAFRDISALGQKMNERWQSMSPEEKTRIATKATIDNLGPIAAAGVGAKLAGSMNIAGALQELGAGARVLGAKEREKYSNVIAGIWEECRPQPMGLTTDGRLMPIPKHQSKKETAVYMTEASESHGANVGKGKEVQSGGSKGSPELTAKPLEKPPVLANGQPLVFDSTAPIEVRVVKANNPKAWDDLGRSPRGKEFHQEMGENLPTNHKSIDSWSPKERIATSFKTRDLRTDSYDSYAKLYRQLDIDLRDLQKWNGTIKTPRGVVDPKNIAGSRLDIGIPDGVINAEQKRALEEIARDAAKRDILFRVTVIR
ncbi:MAG: hypothetical protein IPJ49_29935 [Candidatus Obscuribacter sp.]|nr:hypothetical protein [Candidatus Obscuribacter sp.]